MRPWIRLGVACLCLTILYLLWLVVRPLESTQPRTDRPLPLSLDPTVLPTRAPTQCTYSTCFDASLCAREHTGRPLNRIGVYVYSPPQVPSPGSVSSSQFNALVEAVRSSPYAVQDPEQACVFVPRLDLLNANKAPLQSVNQSPLWHDGVNHLLFNILPGKALLFSGKAILAGAGHAATTYRSTFDVAIPAYNPLLQQVDQRHELWENRPILLTILPVRYKNLQSRLDEILSAYRDRSLAHGSNQTVLLLRHTAHNRSDRIDRIPLLSATVAPDAYTREPPRLVRYEDTLSASTFCAVARADHLGYLGLYDAMSLGCIPVLMDDNIVPPFHEVLDWSRIAVRVRRSDWSGVLQLLAAYSPTDIRRARRQVRFVFDRYMRTMKQIALTTLDIVNNRVFPYYARSYSQWNDPDHVENLLPASPILFYPPRVPSHSQFTVLIRGHDHFAMLCALLEHFQTVPGVERILVVWTNENGTIPAAALWPSLRVPLSVVPSAGGSIHGRYYPYAQLRTEAILSLDDHTCPPSAEEVERAFEAWTHNPGRLIGMVSQREWYANRSGHAEPQLISASFGATFFHKHYLHAFTELLSPTVQRAIDQIHLCEDLVFNWLIMQLSGQSVLTTTIGGSRGQNVPPLAPQIRAMCHLEPYGTCWSALSESNLAQLFSPSVPFRVAPMMIDLV